MMPGTCSATLKASSRPSSPSWRISSMSSPHKSLHSRLHACTQSGMDRIMHAANQAALAYERARAVVLHDPDRSALPLALIEKGHGLIENSSRLSIVRSGMELIDKGSSALLRQYAV